MKDEIFVVLYLQGQVLLFGFVRVSVPLHNFGYTQSLDAGTLLVILSRGLNEKDAMV